MSDNSLSLNEIARRLGARLIGDGSLRVHRVAPLDSAEAGCIGFLSHPRYRRQLQATRASAVLVAEDMAAQAPGAAVVVDNPYAAYARVAAWLHPLPAICPGIAAGAVVDEAARVDPSAQVAAGAVIAADAEVGAECYVGPGCYLGPGVRLGPRCRLLARVTVLDHCLLGADVRIQPGAVIGSDGFGYAQEGGEWLRIPQIGRVVVGDRVEIGANTTIDRGALEDTVIEEGVILDNQIQVAHNVHIGARTAIAGCVGIAGSAQIGRDCTIGGAASVLGHLRLADGVHITATSLVTRSIDEPGRYSSGMPLEPTSSWRRNSVRIRQLDKLARRLQAIEKQLRKRD